VAGIAQRAVKGASLTTAVISVTVTESARLLVGEIYAALALPLDPRTVGAVADRYSAIYPHQVADALADLTAGL
jgi:octanoyl-[GcvH]:protein N-octanoyltransferase